MNLLRGIGEGMAWLPAAPEGVLLLLKATALLALAAGIGLLLQKGHPRARILLWRATLVIVLALPFMAGRGPRFEINVSRPAPATVAEPVDNSPVAAPALNLNPVNPPATSQPISPKKVSPPITPRDWSGIIAGLALAIWMIGVMLAGLRFMISLRQGNRLIANSRPADALLVEEGARVARELGWSKPPVVRLSDEISCPLVAGVIRPTLLLPGSREEEDESGELSGILAHEMGHLRGRDSQWQGAFGFLCVLLWFHPLAWLAASGHIAACEEVCDAAAADYVGSAEAYRRTLARVALAVRGRQPAGALPMARSPQIFRRLEALKRRSKDFVLSRRAKVLLVAAGLAVLFGCGGARTKLIGRTGLYEKAPAARDFQIKLGNNEFRLGAVVRLNDKGVRLIEDGRGKKLVVSGELWLAPEYKKAAAWMDLAEINIRSAEPFEVLDLRVFDHKTQQDLSELGDTGYEFDHKYVHLYRLGQLLPESVDVWLRLENLPKNDPVWQLPGKVGESVDLDGRRISVMEIRSGQWMYSAHAAGVGTPTKITWIHNKSYGPGDNPENDKNKISAAFEWGPPVRSNRMKRYQIWAVAKNGKKYIQDQGYFVNEAAPVIFFDLPLEQLSHFELRPFGGRHRFYFPDVKLPKMTERGFTSPPPAVISVKGRETTFTLDALAPLRITGKILRGNWGVNVSTKGFEVNTELTSVSGNDPKTETTVFYHISGLNAGAPHLTLWDASGKELPNKGLSSGTAHAGTHSMGTQISRTPLEKIDSVQFELK